MTKSINNCLCNENFITSGAVRAFSKTGLCASRSNSRINNCCMTESIYFVSCVSVIATCTCVGCVTCSSTCRSSNFYVVIVTELRICHDLCISSVASVALSGFCTVSCASSVIIRNIACEGVTKCITICSFALVASLCCSACSGIVNAFMLYFNGDSTPCSATVIPCSGFNCVMVSSISRNLKVCSLVPLVVPVVSSSGGVHTAEDNIGECLIRRNFNLINLKLRVVCHANPSLAVTEEVCCKSSIRLLPVRVGSEVKHCLCRCFIRNDVFNFATNRAITNLFTVCICTRLSYKCPNFVYPYVTGSNSLNLATNGTNGIGSTSNFCKFVVARIVIPNA